MLNALLAEISLQGPRIDTVVGKLEAAGMAQHVRVSLDLEPCGLTSPTDELLEVGHGHWRTALGNEQEGRLTLLFAVQPAQCPYMQFAQQWRKSWAEAMAFWSKAGS
jgi:hypothetical protein